ncbi:hypothetical protein DCS_06099 [Drechmeria coniospora]|uniref:Uncharacterized protein n=1 Tax=Drechmeria coniospora TaxID=98403 RepID=A0A151GAN5_DRECN|nr:hypothetical protein DCS_06099 [Drechmeria coniospora]KYK54142.1 hypothetical protein DCS_06099 [Drechmeria coniospora]
MVAFTKFQLDISTFGLRARPSSVLQPAASCPMLRRSNGRAGQQRRTAMRDSACEPLPSGMRHPPEAEDVWIYRR